MSLLMDALRKADETKRTNIEQEYQTQWQTESSKQSLTASEAEKAGITDNPTEEIISEDLREEISEQVAQPFLQNDEVLEKQSETTSLDWQDTLLPQFESDEAEEIIAPIEPIETATELSAVDWEEALLPEFKDDDNTDWAVTTSTEHESKNTTVNWDEEPLLADEIPITDESVKQVKKTLSFQAPITEDVDAETVKTPDQLIVEAKQEAEQPIPDSIQNPDILKESPDLLLVGTHRQKAQLSFQKDTNNDEMPPSLSEAPAETQDNEATQAVAAQRLLAAKTASSKRLYWLYGLLGIILAGMGMGGYYYYTLTAQSGTFLANVPPGGQRSFGNRPAFTPQPPPTLDNTTSTVATATPETLVPVKPIANDDVAENTEQPVSPTPSKAVTTTVVKTASIDDSPDSQGKPVQPFKQQKPAQPSKQAPESFTQATLEEEITPPPSARKPKTILPTKTDEVEYTDVPKLRKTVHSDLNTGLMQAYTAFQRGDNVAAQATYTQVLQQDENNRDALLGLAALALRSGYKQQAQQYYHQVLRLYPQDTLAQVGLITTLGHQTPSHESQLKLLLEKSPDAAYIHFSLGNFYASQNRWPEAQQAYFEAYRYNKQQANYAYNLAISLDRINQPGAALSYYQKALQLTGKQPVQFDIQAVRKRVQTLIAHTPSSALANLSFKAD